MIQSSAAANSDPSSVGTRMPRRPSAIGAGSALHSCAAARLRSATNQASTTTGFFRYRSLIWLHRDEGPAVVRRPKHPEVVVPPHRLQLAGRRDLHDTVGDGEPPRDSG